jgi:hypothetical protein
VSSYFLGFQSVLACLGANLVFVLLLVVVSIISILNACCLITSEYFGNSSVPSVNSGAWFWSIGELLVGSRVF